MHMRKCRIIISFKDQAAKSQQGNVDKINVTLNGFLFLLYFRGNLYFPPGFFSPVIGIFCGVVLFSPEISAVFPGVGRGGDLEGWGYFVLEFLSRRTKEAV